MELQGVSDKLEIHELLARYARGIDLRDWDLWKEVFTPDATLDYSSVGIPVGTRDELAALFEAAFAAVPMTMHYITNVEVELAGDRATARAMFYNPMQLPSSEDQTSCGGCYHHTLVRTRDGWRSERLVEESVWFVNRPDGSVPS